MKHTSKAAVATIITAGTIVAPQMAMADETASTPQDQIASASQAVSEAQQAVSEAQQIAGVPQAQQKADEAASALN